MEGTEFYDVTFAVEDDKEISEILLLVMKSRGPMLPRLLLKKMLVKILSSTKGGILITSCTIY